MRSSPKTGGFSASPEGQSGNSAPRDVQWVSKTTEIEESLIRFIEHDYRDIFDRNGINLESRTYEDQRVRLLKAIHQLIVHEDCAPGDVRQKLGFDEKTHTKPRVIAVTSGKGGVGKTTVALNLAIALAQQDKRTLVLDADLGLANIHVLAGLNPKATVCDVVEGRASLCDAIVEGPGKVSLLCGISGVSQMSDRSRRMATIVENELKFLALKFDNVIIDTGAGISKHVVHFLSLADDIIVVATPDLTSTLDAYGMIKTVHEAELKGRVYLFANEAQDDNEANGIMNKLNACSSRFLDVAISYLGYLRGDDAIRQAGQMRVPVLLSQPDSEASRQIRMAAHKLLAEGKVDLELALSKLDEGPPGKRKGRSGEKRFRNKNS